MYKSGIFINAATFLVVMEQKKITCTFVTQRETQKNKKKPTKPTFQAVAIASPFHPCFQRGSTHMSHGCPLIDVRIGQ